MSPASEYLDSYLNGEDQSLLSLEQMLSLKFSSADASGPYSETLLDGVRRSLVPQRPHPKPTSSVRDFGGLEGSTVGWRDCFIRGCTGSIWTDLAPFSPMRHFRHDGE
jgi:hypothetical protein